MPNKMIKKTVVVFQHEMDLDQFPQLLTYPESELSEFLNNAVMDIFELREKEEKVNRNGSHSFIRIVDVI